MDVRRARPADRPAIRDIARRSLQASYSLGPHAITSAIEEWYDEDRLADTLEDDDRLLLVVEVDGQVVAFSESVRSSEDIGTLLWLHVDPAYRDRGVGETLLESTRDRLEERGVTQLHGRVLADNADGNAFYEEQGFEKAGEEQVEIDGRTHVENIYVEPSASGLEPVQDDSRTVYVDHDNTEIGSVAAFHVVYSDEDGDERYGYYCTNCGALANAMDSLGRIECDACGNVRKPARWDSAYL